MDDLSPIITEIIPALVSLRHKLHQNPELSYQEHETAAIIAAELSSMPGMTVETGIAGTGVVAVLGIEKSGPCVALRSELDALPILESSGLPYASIVPGKMHACGHDGHMSCLIGAARVLSKLDSMLPGPVKFIFQPAEEHGAGAKKMLEAGVMRNPSPSFVFAFHGLPTLSLGSVGVAPGVVMASSDGLRISICGAGTHAAAPHTGRDPIYIASQIVSALQSVVSRQSDPIDSLVLTISKFHAGEPIDDGLAANVIPDTAELAGTLRTLSPERRTSAIEQISEIVTNIAAAFGAEGSVLIEEGYPMLHNAPEAVAMVAQAAAVVIPRESLVNPHPALLAAEDFAYFAEEIPAAMWFLGLCPGAQTSYPFLHSSEFDFVDEAIPLGVWMHCEIVRKFFQDQ